MADLLRIDDVLRRLDYPAPNDPNEWTVDGGHPLDAEDRYAVLTATRADWQAMHDLVVLDRACCHREEPNAEEHRT